MEDRKLKVIRNDAIVGGLNGVVLATCWGVFYGPFQKFTPNVTQREYWG